MTVKRKDFQKTATYIHEFLLKLSVDPECAELRDALNLALLHMQKFYRTLQNRSHFMKTEMMSSNGRVSMSGSSTFGASSIRGMSPMTPFMDAPDKFQWRWVSLEHPNHRMSRSLQVANENGLPIGVPVLHQACKMGDMQTVERIYSQDPQSLKGADGIGRTALMYATHYGQNEIVQWLLDRRSIDVNEEAHDGSTALHCACHDGNTGACSLLLRHKAKVDTQDSLGRASAHWAVTTPTTQCLEMLIQAGADINLRDKDGLSPSMWACRLDNIDHFSIISNVQNQKIDEPDGYERDRNGRTWLHWAVRRKDPLECLKTLLTEENAVLRDDDGKTVMLLAAELGSLAACKTIVDIVGMECLNDKDDQDRTPLHLATIAGHGEVVNFLLGRGVDLEKRDKNNGTVWDYAVNRQLHYCMLIIASHYRQRQREMEDRGEVMPESQRRDSDQKPKTPPRPPTTPPPLEKSPSLPRRLIRSDMNQFNGDIQARSSFNGKASLSESSLRNFDRKQSEDMEYFDLYGSTASQQVQEEAGGSASNMLPDSQMVVSEGEDSPPPAPPPPKTSRGPPVPTPRKVAPSPQAAAQNAAPPENQSVLPVHTAPAEKSKQITSQRPFTRVQPPPMLGHSRPTAPLMSPSPPAGAGRPPTRAPSQSPTRRDSGASRDDDSYESVVHPPLTPPEVKRRPAMPPQLLPLNAQRSYSGNQQQQQKKKRRKKQLQAGPGPELGGQVVPSYQRPAVGRPQITMVAPAESGPLPNGPMHGSGQLSGYARPLQPPSIRTQPASEGLLGSHSALSPRSSVGDNGAISPHPGEALKPPKEFRNDSSNDSTPRDQRESRFSLPKSAGPSVNVSAGGTTRMPSTNPARGNSLSGSPAQRPKYSQRK